MRLLLAAAVLWAAPLFAAPLLATELAPFTATYEVYLKGDYQGSGVITLARAGGERWRLTLDAEAERGLGRLAGYSAEQITEFVRDADGLRPLRATADSQALFRDRHSETVFDWAAGEARFSGDVDDDRRGPVALTDGAMNGQLINVALALAAPRRDAGSELRYALVDRGRSRPVTYRVLAPEAVEVPYGRIEAIPMRSDEPARERTTTAWYSPDLPPTPVRVLQVRRGKPHYELRLVSVSSDAAPADERAG